MVLVDSNVLLDIFTDDGEWCGWSSRPSHDLLS
jgi:hypothetical protein